MFNRPDLGLLREQVFEMAAPARRVIARAIPARRGPIEHRFDPPADAACGFRLCRPYRFDRFHDQPGIDRLNGEIAELGTDVGFERRRPLGRMLGIPPPGAMRLDVGLGTFPKGHRLSRGEAGGRSGTLAFFDWVYPVRYQPPSLRGFLACLFERVDAGRAKAHVTATRPSDLVSKDPAFRPRWLNSQVEAAAISKQARRFFCLNLSCRQPRRSLWHCARPACPSSAPSSRIGLRWSSVDTCRRFYCCFCLIYRGLVDRCGHW